jgi:hypothetical protein
MILIYVPWEKGKTDFADNVKGSWGDRKTLFGDTLYYHKGPKKGLEQINLGLEKGVGDTLYILGHCNKGVWNAYPKKASEDGKLESQCLYSRLEDAGTLKYSGLKRIKLFMCHSGQEESGEFGVESFAGRCADFLLVGHPKLEIYGYRGELMQEYQDFVIEPKEGGPKIRESHKMSCWNGDTPLEYVEKRASLSRCKFTSVKDDVVCTKNA